MQGKYTKKANDVLVRAKEAAAKLGNEYVGTEHILLGLTLVQESVAAKALEGQNVTYHQVMERISEMNKGKTNFAIAAGNGHHCCEDYDGFGGKYPAFV